MNKIDVWEIEKCIDCPFYDHDPRNSGYCSRINGYVKYISTRLPIYEGCPMKNSGVLVKLK